VKDLFVDNCAATNFANPQDEHFKELFKWLVSEGVLVVSQKLLVEYGRSCRALTGENIATLVGYLTKVGRLQVIKNRQLDNFVIPTHRQLKSNFADRVHLKTVLLSHRKYAITQDRNLLDDINSYPRYRACAVARPEQIAYRG